MVKMVKMVYFNMHICVGKGIDYLVHHRSKSSDCAMIVMSCPCHSCSSISERKIIHHRRPDIFLHPQSRLAVLGWKVVSSAGVRLAARSSSFTLACCCCCCCCCRARSQPEHALSFLPYPLVIHSFTTHLTSLTYIRHTHSLRHTIYTGSNITTQLSFVNPRH